MRHYKKQGRYRLRRRYRLVMSVLQWALLLKAAVVGCRFDVISHHAYREAPVDKCKRGKEADHHHILYPSGLYEEEADKHQQDAVDEIQPPVFTLVPVYRADYHRDAPVKEYQGKEIREYHF